MKKTTVTHYKLHIHKPKLREGFFKFVFLSDMHNCQWGEDNDQLLSVISEENPDLILVGGDMLVAYPGEPVEPAADFMKRLAEKQRVYYALGNHEYRLRLYPETYGDMYERYMGLLKGADIWILDNEHVTMDVHGIEVALYGLSIEREYYKRFGKKKMTADYIPGLLGEADREKVNILLAHQPKYIEHYMNWGADISLSGHYHGGVVQLGKNRGLISPDLTLFSNVSHGSLQESDKTAIISAGLGEHTISLRVNNPRELVTVEVYVNKEKKNGSVN